MKRLFYLVLIITLPLIVFFQYWNFRKFNPPSDYDFEISQDIDVNYHDPNLVKEYFFTSEEVGNYARYIWREHRVDVRAIDSTDPEEKQFGMIYKSLIASARFMEGKLVKSDSLKQLGRSNEEIAAWEDGKQVMSTPKEARISAPKMNINVNPIIASIGADNNAAVVREMQQMLYKKGFKIRIDGIYREETKEAVAAFQTKKKLPVTGEMDIDTFIKLMK